MTRNELVTKWRTQAVESREEAGRIRRTMKEPTGAEERCYVRAEIWDRCADELEDALASTVAGLEEKKDHGAGLIGQVASPLVETEPCPNRAERVREILTDYAEDLRSVTWLAPVSASEMNTRDRWLADQLDAIASLLEVGSVPVPLTEHSAERAGAQRQKDTPAPAVAGRQAKGPTREELLQAIAWAVGEDTTLGHGVKARATFGWWRDEIVALASANTPEPDVDFVRDPPCPECGSTTIFHRLVSCVSKPCAKPTKPVSPALCEQPCEKPGDCDRPCIRPDGHDGGHECKSHKGFASVSPAPDVAQAQANLQGAITGLAQAFLGEATSKQPQEALVNATISSLIAAVRADFHVIDPEQPDEPLKLNAYGRACYRAGQASVRADALREKKEHP